MATEFFRSLLDMITTNQKKVAVLAALGLLWGGILAWEWLAVEEPVRVPLTNVSGPASRLGHAVEQSMGCTCSSISSQQRGLNER